jgi:hypothetical protein
MHQLADRALGKAHDLCHLGPAAALDGGLDQRVALSCWKVRHGCQRVIGQHPPLGELVNGLAGSIRLVEIDRQGRDGGFPPHQVAQDLVQPASEMAHVRP